MLIDDSAFPEEWEVSFPEDTAKDPIVNQVFQRWGRKTVAGAVRQTIFRAYTIDDAKDGYADLQDQYMPTPSSFDEIFMLPEEPDEIHFVSTTADEWHLGCGWSFEPYCL